MRSGLFSGSTWTAIPTRNRFVRVAIELAITIGADSADGRREVHLAEPHAVQPPRLGGVHDVETFAERVAWSPPRRISNSMKMPKSMGFLFFGASAAY